MSYRVMRMKIWQDVILSNEQDHLPIATDPINLVMSYATSDDDNEDEVSLKVFRTKKNASVSTRPLVIEGSLETNESCLHGFWILSRKLLK